jgi:hypothetical protein
MKNFTNFQKVVICAVLKRGTYTNDTPLSESVFKELDELVELDTIKLQRGSDSVYVVGDYAPTN